MPVNPGVYNGGVPIRGLVSLPATTEMLTVDAAGNMSRQSIPIASFGALTGLPSDNAALASALAAKVNLAGDTMTGTLTAPEYRSPRAGSLSHVNPQNNIVLYGGFAGYGIGFDGNGELGTIVNGTLRSRLGQHLGLGSAGQVRFNSAADTSGSWDTLILRNATGPTLETRSTNGLKVCNADGSNTAQLEAQSVLFGTQVRDQYGIGFRSQAGYMTFYGFNTVGSNSPTMSVQTDGVRIVGKTILGAANYSEAFGSEALKVGGTGIVSAFGTDPAVVQVGSRGDSAPSVNAFLGGYSAAAGNVSTVYFGQNLYFDGTNWVHPYVAGRSSLFYQQNGAFYWNTHAGNAATGVGTERMSLSNSGTLAIGGQCRIQSDAGFASISPTANRNFLLASGGVQLWNEGSFRSFLDWSTLGTVRFTDGSTGRVGVDALTYTSTKNDDSGVTPGFGWVDNAGAIGMAQWAGQNRLYFVTKGARRVMLNDTAMYLENQLAIGASMSNGSNGVYLAKDINDTTLAQRNGVNPQTFRVYNTFTSATDGEYLQQQWASNEARIGTAVGSAGGTQRNMVLGSWNAAGTWMPAMSVRPTDSAYPVKFHGTTGIWIGDSTTIENARLWTSANAFELVNAGALLGTGSIKLTDWNANTALAQLSIHHTKNLSFAIDTDNDDATSAFYFLGGTHASGNPTTNGLMKIEKGGNVGIGTMAPSAKLHVAGTVTANGALTVNNAAGIYETGSGRTVALTSNFSASTPGIGTTTNHDFCIYTNGANERLRFASTGLITASSNIALTGSNPQVRFGSVGQGYVEYSSGALNLGHTYATSLAVNATQVTSLVPIVTSQTITHGFQTLTADPTTSDIASGLVRVVKNSTSGELRLWANDGGTMKSVLLS